MTATANGDIETQVLEIEVTANSDGEFDSYDDVQFYEYSIIKNVETPRINKTKLFFKLPTTIDLIDSIDWGRKLADARIEDAA